jgi:hypothetical protein
MKSPVAAASNAVVKILNILVVVLSVIETVVVVVKGRFVTGNVG